MDINELLKLVVDKGASDMHLRVPGPPVLRIDGELVPQLDLPPVTAKDLEKVFEDIAGLEQREAFLKEKDLDFAYSLTGLVRMKLVGPEEAMMRSSHPDRLERLLQFNFASSSV